MKFHHCPSLTAPGKARCFLSYAWVTLFLHNDKDRRIKGFGVDWHIGNIMSQCKFYLFVLFCFACCPPCTEERSLCTPAHKEASQCLPRAQIAQGRGTTGTPESTRCFGISVNTGFQLPKPLLDSLSLKACLDEDKGVLKKKKKKVSVKTFN